jgi:hypothetical protein
MDFRIYNVLDIFVGLRYVETSANFPVQMVCINRPAGNPHLSEDVHCIRGTHNTHDRWSVNIR